MNLQRTPTRRSPPKWEVFHCNPLNIILVPEARMKAMSQFYDEDEDEMHYGMERIARVDSWQYDSGVGSLINEG